MSKISVRFEDGHEVEYYIRTVAIAEAFRDLESNPNVESIHVL